jgi:hypothetical protein
MLKIAGGAFWREALNDLPTRCGCCVNRRQLIVIPDADGFLLKCPATNNAFSVRHRSSRVFAGLYTGGPVR